MDSKTGIKSTLIKQILIVFFYQLVCSILWRTHIGDKPYHCTHLEKSCVWEVTLVKHYRAHTGDKPYKCFYCEKSFANLFWLITRGHTLEISHVSVPNVKSNLLYKLTYECHKIQKIYNC